MKTRTFRGGIKIEEYKGFTEHKPIETLAPPSKLYISLKQNAGSLPRPVVEIGQEVTTGELIAAPSGAVSSTLHASVSGKVIAIASHPHPSGPDAPAIVIQTSPSAEQRIVNLEPLPDWESIDPELIRTRVLEAGIVGMGGAGFPTQVKLEPPPGKKIETAVINGAECEPFLTVDHRLLLEETEKVVTGLKIIMKTVGAERGIVAVEANKFDAFRKLESLLEKQKNIFPVLLKVKYPQGAEKQLLKAVTGREVPSGGLPSAVGCVVQNVHTAAAIADAVLEGKPLIERVVTVTGPELPNPGNFRVRIGTPFASVIEHAGGIVPGKRPVKVIMGGPLMGIAQYTLEVPIIKSTSGILVLDDSMPRKSLPCVKCGACVEVCPMNLMPCRISELSERDDFAGCDAYRVRDCMECGACAYNCMSGRPIVHLIKYAKFKLNNPQKSQGAQTVR